MVAIAKNVGYQSRAKHIDTKYHFVRKQVKAKNIELHYVDTRRQLADLLAKPKRFEILLAKSNIRQYSSSFGDNDARLGAAPQTNGLSNCQQSMLLDKK